MNKCSIKDCDKKYRCKGYCDMHYRRFLTHGDASKVRIVPMKCSVKDCETKPKKLGMCIKHHARFKKWGDPHKFIVGRAPNLSLCKYEGCIKMHRTQGYCSLHYNRLWRNGAPDIVLKPTGPIAKYPTMKERFLNSFEMVTESGCWIWIGCLNDSGYGLMTWKNKSHSAHRFSYKEFIGVIPTNMCVLHKCDIPACVNPNHLMIGTSADNVKDKMQKGRQAKGEMQGHVKLTEIKIKEIRSSNICLEELAAKYGVHTSTIRKIRARQTWRHVE